MENPVDPKGLIRESYRIEGVSSQECRMIFLDWALSLPSGEDVSEHIRACLALYGVPDHPMTKILNEGLAQASHTGRRGGRASRRLTDDSS